MSYQVRVYYYGIQDARQYTAEWIELNIAGDLVMLVEDEELTVRGGSWSMFLVGDAAIGDD